MRGDVSRVQAAEEPSSKGESEMGDVLSTLGVALTAAIALVLIQRFKHAPFFSFSFLFIYIYTYILFLFTRVPAPNFPSLVFTSIQALFLGGRVSAKSY